jgi:hypothetical protein
MLVMLKTGAWQFFDSPCASGTTVDSLVTTSRRQLAFCTCLVSGWHKLWAFTLFLDDEDDTTPDFRGFSISRDKKIVNCS